MRRFLLGALGLALLTLPGCGDAGGDGDVSVFSLRVGDCYDDQDDREVVEVAGISCDQPHDNEVIALFDLPDGPWPGEEEVRARAHSGCFERFEGAVGTSYETSALAVYPIAPVRSSWDEQNDREVVCAAYDKQFEKLTTSVLGSGR